MGPGVIVAAAFIGPGTVTMCSIAGAKYGMSLLWAMAISILATIVLQEMASRVGWVTGEGLAAVIKKNIGARWIKGLLMGLIMIAILIGNAAYEGGNISGGIMGINALTGAVIPKYFWSLFIGVLAFTLLYFGNYKVLEKVLTGLVALLGISFLITGWMVHPSIDDIVKGLLMPSIPRGSIWTILGLIGTTVVPYNLFLHSSLVRQKWGQDSGLGEVRLDTILAIGLGGIVSMFIIIAASRIHGDISNGADLAKGLEPLYGPYARILMAIGLFAAGLTSAITAPMAAGFVASELVGDVHGSKSRVYRLAWISVLFLGVIFSSLGYSPVSVIKIAQVTNGLLLPIMTGFLLWVVNKKPILGKYTNTASQNILSVVILGFTLFLGAKVILKVIGWY